ncbi:hypothetical protein F5X99DRAFT_417730 [Biscogniauxia marginata]|nr:hypothetical protein F5X99DRAFT_417730 [Biscogniauxia marginata]
MATSVSTSTYETVQNWISRQLESRAPVTEAQRELLLHLELTINPRSPPRPEPELDDINWIGLLQEYRAARQRVPGGRSVVNFTEAPVDPLSRGPPNWYSQVTIDEHPEPFPGAAGGLFEDGTQPSFFRKKDAKKYAAKCAVEWLRANGYMPQAGGVKFPKPQQPAPKPLSLPKNAKPASLPQASNPPKTPNNAPKTPAPVSPFDDTQPSAAFEVARLCKDLGWQPPQYRIEPDPSAGGFFSGYPDLGINASLFPDGVGRVNNILSKKAAKEKIAEDLLKPLKQIYNKHQEDIRKFFESPPAATPK